METIDVPHLISWADTERDLSAWLGNAMQSNSIHELYRLERSIRASRDPDLLNDWRKLQVSDHFYYMCTKYFADGDVHKYFNPYDSPYDSYINFMNVLDNLGGRCAAAAPQFETVDLPSQSKKGGSHVPVN
jgi:alpha-amylase